jgi:threonine aldolase
MNSTNTPAVRGFASDNNAGVHPEIFTALQNANSGHTLAYGNDDFTKKATESLRYVFGPESEIFFVFNGTAANVLGLSTLTLPYHAVICPETAHINVDECGAPEKFTGCKLISVPAPHGKLTVSEIKKHMHGIGDEHHSQPHILSISQSTEMGTVYTPSEIRELAEYAHANNMKLHMDGARISNAAVSLGLGFAEFTGKAGVDVLSFGGTKNGLMFGEAVVFFDRKMAADFRFRRKQGMQLASKMRFIAVQFSAFLENELWKRNASHANKMARLLCEKVKGIPQIHVTQEVQSNGVFVIMPVDVAEELRKDYFFYPWDESRSEYRWMTSFDTTEHDINGFISRLKELLSGK